MSFTGSVLLCVDFETSRLFLFGQLASPLIAHAMLMGKWKPAGTSKYQRHFVSLATRNLAQIWNDLDASVFSFFDVALAGVKIVSLDGTVGELQAELLEYVAAAYYINERSQIFRLR